MKKILGIVVVVCLMVWLAYGLYGAHIQKQENIHEQQTPLRDGYEVTATGTERVYQAAFNAVDTAADENRPDIGFWISFTDMGLMVEEVETLPGEALALRLSPTTTTSADFASLVVFDVPGIDFETAFETGDATCIDREIEDVAGYVARKRSCQQDGIVADSYLVTIDADLGRYMTFTAQYDRSAVFGMNGGSGAGGAIEGSASVITAGGLQVSTIEGILASIEIGVE